MSTKTKSVKDYTNHEFVFTRVFQAPRDLVFQAWTDPQQLAQWWGPKGFTNPVCEWDARPGRAIHVVMRAPNGAEYPMGGEFREVVPPERLVFTRGALYEHGRLLFELLHEVVFVEENGQTTLTLRSQVIKTTGDANKYIGGYDAGMSQSLERLAALVAGKAPPLTIERTYQAPTEKVWRALTSAEAMKQWYFDIKEFKPEVGFEFEFSGACEGGKYLHRCKVTEVIPGKKLAYSWRYEGYEGESLVTIELFPEGDQTRLRLTHAGLETFPKLPHFARSNFAQGWNMIIGENLKKAVETKA
jgi:uncharacterized protein YndB with AHSA1/START domain